MELLTFLIGMIALFIFMVFWVKAIVDDTEDKQ